MAGTDQLQRIAELTKRLAPLGEKQRGMPIQADDWNALVDALRGVLAVDRAQETATRSALKTGFAAAEHEHLGGVAVPWLDAVLQDRMGQGEGPVTLRLSLSDALKRVAALGSDVARLSATVEAQRQEGDRAAVDNLARGRTLAEFEGRFAGLEDLRTSVVRIGSQVDGLGGAIATVLELRGQLTDPFGLPIDVAGLQDSVANLQTLEERLTGVDGSPLRVRDLEVRIQELADAVGAGAGGGLDDRIAGVVASAEGRLAARLDGRMGAVEETSDARGRELEGRIDEAMAHSQELRAAMDASIADRATALQQDLVGAVDERVAAAREGLASELAASTSELVEGQLAGVPALIQAGVAEARAQTEAALTESLTAAVDARIAEARTALEQRLVTVEATVDGIVGSVVESRLADALPGLESRLDERMGGALDRFRDELGGIVEERVKTRVAEVMADVNATISTEIDRRAQELDARMTAAIDARFAVLQPRIAEEVSVQLQAADIDGRISGSQDHLREEFSAEIGGAVAQVQAQTQERLAGAVRAFDARVGDMSEEFRSGLAKQASELEALRLRVPPPG